MLASLNSARSIRAKIVSWTLTVRTPWFPIVFKSGSLVLLTMMSLCAGILMAAQRKTSIGDPSVMWQEAFFAGLLGVIGLTLHELGHAIAGRMTGRTVVRIQIGLAGGAITSGDSTPVRRMIGIVAGPLTEIAFGATLFTLANGNLGDAVGVAGFISLLNGIGNLLPLHKAMDGSRFILFAKLALRGNLPISCAPSGPCPACAGATVTPSDAQGTSATKRELVAA